MVSVHCRAHRLASACYFPAEVSTVWCMKLRKHFNENFTVSIGLPGDASDYNEDKKSTVAARMQSKVVVE